MRRFSRASLLVPYTEQSTLSFRVVTAGPSVARKTQGIFWPNFLGTGLGSSGPVWMAFLDDLASGSGQLCLSKCVERIAGEACREFTQRAISNLNFHLLLHRRRTMLCRS